MKAFSAILFTVLYAAFSCFAITGSAASKCYYSTCGTSVVVNETAGKITVDNNADNCTHPPAITAHVVHKQTNSTDGGGNKYLPLNSITLYKYNSGAEQVHSSKVYAHAGTVATCPLFIKHCMLLI